MLIFFIFTRILLPVKHIWSCVPNAFNARCVVAQCSLNPGIAFDIGREMLIAEKVSIDLKLSFKQQLKTAAFSHVTAYASHYMFLLLK